MSYDTNVVSPRNIVNPNLQSLLDTGLVLVLDPNKVGAALATLATPVFSVNNNPAGTGVAFGAKNQTFMIVGIRQPATGGGGTPAGGA